MFFLLIIEKRSTQLINQQPREKDVYSDAEAVEGIKLSS